MSSKARDRILSGIVLVLLGGYVLYGMTHPDFTNAMLRLSSSLP